MIILDTIVLSALMRVERDEAVLSWFAGQPPEGLFTTTVTEAEIRYGVALLPLGQRRTGLLKATAAIFDVDLAGRVLAFDSDAARAYAEIAAHRRQAGRPILPFDAQIAAIAHSRGATVATRNVADFEGCGIEVVNPWTSQRSP